MALPLQAKLLRVLQERVVERLGSNRLLPVDCRVVAATKLDLKAEAEAGRFRADLYWRLNVVTIPLPPLRARREDIPLLFNAFCLQAAERFRRPLPERTPALFEWLMAQDWPGNVRELQHVADRFALGVWRPGAEIAAEAGAGMAQRVAAFEQVLIDNALRECGGDVGAAAERLQVPRKTLYDKIARFGIAIGAYRAS